MDGMLSLTKIQELSRFIRQFVTSLTLLEGLPPEWELLLKISGLTAEDVKTSPSAVMKVLAFQQSWHDSIALLSSPVRDQPIPKLPEDYALGT